MKNIDRLLKDNLHLQALAALLGEARSTTDYNRYMSLCRKRQKIGQGLEGSRQLKDLRIAILGGATTDFLLQPFKLELETQGVGCDLFCSDYNTYVHEMLEANSATAAFCPDVAVFLITPFNISEWPVVGDPPDRVQALIDRICDHWLGLCEAFHSRTNCEIIISNQHLLPVRITGNLGCRMPWEPNIFLRQLNIEFAKRAPGFVHIFDVDTLATIYGVSNWFDTRFWHHSKQPVSFDCLVPYVRNLAAIVAALYGQVAKCLVLDLDNTLWGGVVGDDGVEGLRIGEGDAEGEAFKAFQEYLLRLKQRGLLLAVCSKNEPENALLPFEQLPEMVLRRSDFVAFKASWNPKTECLQEIARDLNIGLDALVFVDDNPAERALVRQYLPEVKVVELSGDPAEYPLLLDQSGWIEPGNLTDEDRYKTEQYQTNLQRSDLQMKHADYDSYLESLGQKAVIHEFQPKYLERITQLINKTNQFNLTTQRLGQSEVEALMQHTDTFTACVRLADRFGDNGLISVLSGNIENDVLKIDLWLMSCRVFKRSVEYLLANYLFEKAGELGIESVEGIYKPTQKNKIVANFYPDLGFNNCSSENDGATYWKIRLDDYKPVSTHITLVDDL